MPASFSREAPSFQGQPYPFSFPRLNSRRWTWLGAALLTSRLGKSLDGTVQGQRSLYSGTWAIAWPPLLLPGQPPGAEGQDSGCLERACPPVLIRNAVCVFGCPSQSKHWRQQGYCALRSPVTLNRPSWHNASWSLLGMSSSLPNSSLINDCFLAYSRQLYSREGWRPV